MGRTIKISIQMSTKADIRRIQKRLRWNKNQQSKTREAHTVTYSVGRLASTPIGIWAAHAVPRQHLRSGGAGVLDMSSFQLSSRLNSRTSSFGCLVSIENVAVL